MATDLAEFVGAAIGLNLLFGVPLFPAGLITAVVAFGVLALEQRGYRRFELAIAALLGLVLLGFVYDLIAVGAQPGELAKGLIPSFGGDGGVLLAAGIIGATVMPHVVYLHSALTKARVACRDDGERRELLRFTRIDVLVGLGTAGLINLTMLVVAASLFGSTGRSDVDTIEAAHAGLAQLVGGGAALAFAVALLASGLSSSSVGTYAGQVVMQGFIRRRIPLLLRRGLTMLPALVVLGLGLPATESLIVSQVVLSFGIPFALVPLALLTRRRDVMGSFVNKRSTTVALGTIADADHRAQPGAAVGDIPLRGGDLVYAMSELGRLSLGLLAAGLAGVLLALLYLRACAWADWDLMSSRVRRRVHSWERRVPVFSAGAGLVAGIGLVLVLLDGFT